MMGRQSGQLGMQVIDMEMMIPQGHLLRKIDKMIRFDFIYELLAPYYPPNGRPSVDPVSMFKMLLVGYLYGIKSERRLVEEVRLNLAYRWFCGIELWDTIPDHSTFSKTRTRKWQQSRLFQKVFREIVQQCVASGLVDGKAMAADGSYLPANVSRESWKDVEIEVEQSMQSYLDCLDEELAEQPGFRKPSVRSIKKRHTTSSTDPDCGYINHGTKRGVGYLMETTVDCKHGILTGVDVYSANQRESLLVLRHLERQIQANVPMHRIALDRGYDTGAVHRGLELLGITGYIPAIQFPNAPEKYGFSYDANEDAFICPEGKHLAYHRLNCNQSTGKYLRCYQASRDDCLSCHKRGNCFETSGSRRRVLASSCYPAFFRGHSRVGTAEYLRMMRLRKIWAEGSFAVLKREHCLSKIRKRGILAVTEECLLSAMALNLKRMVKALFFTVRKYELLPKFFIFIPYIDFVNRSYYDMIMAPELMEGEGGLFAQPFQQKYGRLIEDLFGRLAMSDDTQLNARRQSELQQNIERYTDFRTYLKFDLETTDQNGSKQLLSQTLNTKSGGETQTPFYIAVLASFAQLYQVNNLSALASNTVRLAVFDEAFNKMDSDRIVESVRLLRKMGLQAIICTPPDKLSDIMPLADKTFLVSKDKYKMHILTYGKEIVYQ